MDTIPVAPINEAIKAGGITYSKCLGIVEMLDCFYKVRGVLNPGPDQVSDMLDISLCTAARAKKNLPPQTVNMDDSPEFPTVNGGSVPELCSLCEVFTPALVQLNQLIQIK